MYSNSTLCKIQIDITISFHFANHNKNSKSYQGSFPCSV